MKNKAKWLSYTKIGCDVFLCASAAVLAATNPGPGWVIASVCWGACAVLDIATEVRDYKESKK